MDGPDDTDTHSPAGRLEPATVQEIHNAFVDSTTDIFTYIKPDGTMAYISSTEEMSGRSREEFIETPLEEYLHPEDKERGVEHFKRALAGESTKPVELRFRHGDGDWIWIEVNLSQIPPEYDINGVVTVSREITDRKRQEQKIEDTKAELEQSNKKLRRQNRRLDRFASAVSHDLQNPLDVAQGQLERAREEHDSDRLKAVARAHTRMETLIDDLLTVARAGDTRDITAIKLGKVVELCWQNVETDSVELLLEADCTVRADRHRLQQLLENLLANSIEHGGDDITVMVDTLSNGFYIEDDGPGIPETEREQVFEAGYSTAEEGTGFGLSIVEEAAEAHGWAVSLTEGSNGGARFEITDVEFAE